MSRPSTSKTGGEKTKKTSKSKDKSFKSTEFVNDLDNDLDNEGPSAVYKAPPGTVLCTEYIDAPEFDYDELKRNDDLELWIIKAPAEIKPKHFNSFAVSTPTPSTSSHIGTLSRKAESYDVWSVKGHSQGHTQTALAGGDELRGLTCLVPRKKKGSLVIAPKSFEHQVVITAHSALPTPPLSSPEVSGPSFLQDPERYKYPARLLKHRFLPIGALSGVRPKMGGIDIDMVDVVNTEPIPLKSPKKNRGEKTDAKVKKRKDTESTETPKRVKKAKAGS